MSNRRIALGVRGEEMAAGFLRQKGYNILARRYRTANGEIDIIAEQGGILVFIEVKARANAAFGTPAEAVTARKRKTISTVAQQYLLECDAMDRPARFDVIEVYMGEGRICHITDAFFSCLD
jgi:putative endonuclease